MSEHINSLVSTEWLAANLDAPDLIILDASRHLPAANRDPIAEFEADHIPGSRFLDLANLTDTASPVPQALPNAAQLAQQLARLGVQMDHRIVLYDDSAVKTAARAWFMLIAHGIENVAILDGGLAKWRGEGRALETGQAEFAAAAVGTLAEAQGLRFKADILANLESKEEQVLDARAADRVFGNGIDPVHGGENGRIPGSCNLPFGQAFNGDGTYKSADDLRTAFEGAGIDLSKPIVTSCGSGVTASVLLFALHLIGKYDIALYDGSWAEWSADPATPKQQGPQ
ncbi:sulfurtransferase [Erythrobacter sp. F6033]|uniref:sulfurtransferase n=1 Tax=Erythrobacter sp. F6033 TaxID=2926401 RepID=UPI001FF585AA|nr:sulfurtransferase [Erythrobacter sp. F6033]MCK0128988.1 sulfurtransferase [Erythrobacter sp. F6033]